MGTEKTIKERTIYEKSLIGWSILQVIILLPLFFVAEFNHDELEHIHSGWYIAGGWLPYVDFFQNHNPLLWYLLAPAIKLFGDSVASILAARSIALVFLLGNVALTYLVTLRLTSSRPTSLLAAVLLLSANLFIEASIEVRPDIPQVFFGMASLYFLIGFLQTQSPRQLLACGLCLATSFLFLQKAIFLMAAIGLVLLYRWVTRNMLFSHIIVFGAACLVPLACFAAILSVNGMFGDYLITNWLVNLNRLNGFSPMKIIHRYMDNDFLLYGCAAISIPYLLLNRRTTPPVQIMSWIILLLSASILMNNRPHKQNFLQFMPLLAINVAIMLDHVADRLQLNLKPRVLILALLVLVPIRSVIGNYEDTNKRQLEAIEYVLQHSSPQDMIYDGDIRFNVFRPDLHYFWYSTRRGKLLDAYNLVTNNRYGDYDAHALIRTFTPKFISGYAIDTSSDAIASNYGPTSFHNIFQRIPASQSSMNRK